MKSPFLRLLPLISGLLLGLPLGAQTFTSLGTGFIASGMSADSTKVVGSGSGALAGGSAFQTGLLWTSSGLTSLGYLSGETISGGAAISRDGSTVVGTSPTSTQSRSFIETVGSGSPTGLPLASSYDGMSPAGLSANGTLVAGTLTDSNFFRPNAGYVWTSGGGTQVLSPLAGGSSSQVKGVTANGVILGASDDANGLSQATVWSSGAPTSLGVLCDGRSTVANAGTANATTVVGESTNFVGTALIGFYWTTGASLTALNPLTGGTGSGARAVSDDGLLFGGYSNGGTLGGNRATLWDRQGNVYSLSALLAGTSADAHWTNYQNIVAINGHDGVYDILGFGNNGSGTASFLITGLALNVIPEPSTYAVLAGAAALGLALWRRRSGRTG